MAKFRKSFVPLKLILGSNEQALILTDLLENLVYEIALRGRTLDEVSDEEKIVVKSRRLIMEDTGVLTATVKNTIDKLYDEGFIDLMLLKSYMDYSDPIYHYRLDISTQLYLDKAIAFMNKKHRPDDKRTVKKILIPFIEKLKSSPDIFRALDLGKDKIY